MNTSDKAKQSEEEIKNLRRYIDLESCGTQTLIYILMLLIVENTIGIIIISVLMILNVIKAFSMAGKLPNGYTKD